MTILIEQALYASKGGYQFVARSPGFVDDWLSEAEQLCVGFGERPAGVACPASIFARPFGPDRVAVVQVADQGSDDAGRPGALGFHILILPRRAYEDLLGDPFAVADRCPPPWEARGHLPSLSLPAEPLPVRTVAEVQQILQRPDSATLLGGTQALIDGGKLVFERAEPEPALLRCFWKLLPASTRCKLWPASFSFGNGLGFDVLIVPRIGREEWDTVYAGYLREEQAGDYPEGRYELNLQIAAEASDQGELDSLFFRRSSVQTFRLALVLLVAMLLLSLALRLLTATDSTPPLPTRAVLPLPPASAFATLSGPERQRLTDALHTLAVRLKIEPLPEASTAETLLAAIDQRLGTPPTWAYGPIKDLGPPERQLRALLRKQGIPGYDDFRLNSVELVERLQERVAPR